MSNSVSKTFFSLLTVSTLFLTGCSNAATQTESIAQSNLPVVKVDKDHSQIRKKGMETARTLMYELEAPVKGFVLDTSSFNFSADAPSETAKKAIQVIVGKGNIMRIPYKANDSLYTVEPKSVVNSGQMMVIGIGYEDTPEGNLQFYPSWAGVIKVK